MMEEESGKIKTPEVNLPGEQHEMQSGTGKRPDSPVTSSVSLKSDRSLPVGPNFKKESDPQESGTGKRPDSPVTSSVSLKSDRSLPVGPNFKKESDPQERDSRNTTGSSVSRQKPLKQKQRHNSVAQQRDSRNTTDSSVPRQKPLKQNQRCSSVAQQRQDSESVFSGETQTEERDSRNTTDSSVPRQKPLKQNQRRSSVAQQRYQMSQSATTGDKPQKHKDFFSVFNDLEDKMIVFIKHELEMYKKLVRNEYTDYYRKVEQIRWDLKQRVLGLTLSFLNLMNCEDVASALQNELIGIVQRPLKEGMKNKYYRVREGIAKQGESTSLNKIYTDLYITVGGAGQVSKQHEVGLIEKNQTQQDVQIKCTNMFECLTEQDRPIRTVMTQGVAGVGKSICVQKFILDWAEGEQHQDIQFIIPLPFRELNLKKGCHSLMDIISFFFPETKGLILTDQNKVMFIFDGLDECKLPLSFQKNEILHNVCEAAPLDVVLTNLIKGNLLPSAQIWITTRPAAASMIPAECVDRVSEVRGFNDQQKEEYFKNQISDENMANKIIEHIKQSRSLFIMCHIPVFCWISATVLQRILEETENGETPKTLTNMYTCFLIFQAVQGNVKYTGRNDLDIPWDEEAIVALGRLAFQHLEENNLIFYTSHLEACGIDPSKISVYSGLCTQETGRFLGTVFSFVHLSIQEFLAAVFAYICVRNEHRNVFEKQSTSQESKTTELIDFLKTAVDKALESVNGHLDLFLRFLLGLSLESNEELIRGLLTQKGKSSDCQKEIVEYIKLKFEENTSPERSINLFYCLNELNDDSLVKEIQNCMSSGSLSDAKLSPAQWSALVFVLLTSKEKLEEFDLKKFIRSEECLNRLLPVVKEATSALLSECNLTERSCSDLLEVLNSESSTLTLLDLSNNPIQDCGVVLLSEGLKSPNCKLEKLRLSDCKFSEKSCPALLKVLSSEFTKLTLLDLSNNPIQDCGVVLLSEELKSPNCKLEELSLSFCSITGKGYGSLSSALKSNTSSSLTELDLRGNDPGDSGVKKLTDLLSDPQWKLNKLRLLKNSVAEQVCVSLTKTLGANPLLQRELDLSVMIHGDLGIEKLSLLLEDSHCRTTKLKLNNRSITEKGCLSLSSALCSNPSHLIELDLGDNKIGNFGVEKLCALLTNEHCNLERLSLSGCGLTEEGYSALASTLKSNPSSHIKELDLSGNDPGSNGVKLITDLQKETNSKLEKLRLLKSSDAEELCASLTKDLGTNPLLLRDLDLSGKILGDSAVKQLSELLKDLHCRPEKLKLNCRGVAEEGWAALSSALSSNPSHLIELDLSGNQLLSAGVKKFCTLLENPQCQLQKLDLSDCGVTGEGYSALTSALKFNSSSHLTELSLRGNDPGDTGVKNLHNLLEDSMHKLNTLRLLKSSAAEEVRASLTEVLGTNPLLLRELNLSGKIRGDSDLIRISVLLEDLHCRPKILKLEKSDITEKGCAALSSALCSNPSHLIQLHLSQNKLENSGVNHLNNLLRNPHCNLQILSVSDNNITEKGYAALASALKSNPSSHLEELDLRGNDPGDTGVELITDLQKAPNCKLKTLRFLKDCDAEEICTSLTKALRTNPLLLKVLDLRGRIQGDSEMKKLSAMLVDVHCRTKTLKLNNKRITEKAWVDLFSALFSNPSHLIELDLSGNELGDSGMQKLCGLLENKQLKLSNMQLCDCNITETSASLTSALKSNPSHLKELGLSNNKLGNSGVKQLIDLLQSSNCSLEKINLSFCNISEEGYEALASALKSNSPLVELDLRGNDPGDKGVELLTALLEDPNCILKTLRLLSDDAVKACAFLKRGTNPLLLRELDLSEKIQGDSEMKQISDLLKDPHCRTEKLKLNSSSITDRGWAALSSALKSKPSHLKELDLSGNKLENSGVTEISHLLKMANCNLTQLNLSDCSITEEGYAALASALISKPSSHQVELDLRGNDPGKTGVEKITQCKLKKLRLLKTAAAQEAWTSLSAALKKDVLLHTDLNLSRNPAGLSGDSRVKQLCALLPDTHCKLSKLQINNDDLTKKSCSALATVLPSSTLRELDLSHNNLQNSGVNFLCNALKNRQCKLQILSLSFCSVTGEGYAALAKALKLNSSVHLIQLDLRGNDPGDTGVKEITDCKLNKLRLLESEAGEEAFTCIKTQLRINPLLERKLDLSEKKPKDINVMQLSALLEDPHCRLKKLRMYKVKAGMLDFNAGMTEQDCATLISALIKNPSHLRELDLNENKLDQPALLKLCDLLKNPRCRLEKLKLKNCSIKEEGCAALVSALTSSPSQLKELDLSKNPLGKSLEKLAELLRESGCVLRVDRSLLEKAGNVLSYLFGWSNKDKPEEKAEDNTLAKTEAEPKTPQSADGRAAANQNKQSTAQSAGGDGKGKQRETKIPDTKSQSSKNTRAHTTPDSPYKGSN